MKKITLLFLLCITNSFAQYIVNTIYSDNGNHFVYNGNLYFSGSSGFSKYDGVMVTPVPNPSGVSGSYLNSPIVYNENFYFKFSGNFLAKYDGTNIVLVDKVSPSDFGVAGPIENYNSKLTYIYRGGSNNLRQLATYDGTTQTIYPNPDAATSAYSNFLAEYNGEAFYSYVNQDGNTALAKFNGSTVTLIPNPTTDSWGVYSGNACVVNNKLIFLFQTSDGKVHFANYDGATITVAPNQSENDDLIYYRLVVYNGAVYARYRDLGTGKFHIAKYDGTTMTILPNLNAADMGYMDSPFVYNNKLYFRYSDASSPDKLARTDGAALEVLPLSYFGGFRDYALEIAGNVYFKSTSSGFATLGKFDGTTLTTYGNISNTNPLLATNELVFFNNKIHFVADGKLSYLDQVILETENFETNEFKLYPNPSIGDFTIQTSPEMIGATSEVYNLLGQNIKSFEITELETKQNLNPGIYVMVIEKEGKKHTQKIIVK